MVKESLQRELEKIGLSEKEAGIYLAGLELGPTTAQKLAAKATIVRPTAYIMIESLIKKGLMSYFEKGKKRYFTVSSPKQLLRVIQNQKKEIFEKEKAVQEMVERLASFSANERIFVRTFEGLEGVNAAQEDMSSSGAREAYEISAPDADGGHITDEVREKIAKNFDMFRSLAVGAKKPRGEKRNGIESRRLDEKHGPVAGEYVIYGDRVCMISRGTAPTTVILEDKDFADTFRTMYLALWDRAERYAE